MRTFRRLNDPERYYGLSWRGRLAGAAGGGLLYAAVGLSPLQTKPTISITVVVLGVIASLLYGLSGQALGPGRFVAAAIAYRLSAKHLTLPDRPDGYWFALSGPPPDPDPAAGQIAAELDEALT
jgi:hypothetical protein